MRAFFSANALKLAGAGMVALGLLCLWLYAGNLRLEARLAHQQAETVRVTAAMDVFVNRVTAASERIRAGMATRALAVEREQSRITQEVSRDYQARVIDLHRRADALRVRQNSAAATGPGGRGADLPSVPAAPGRLDAAAVDHGLSFERRVIASEQAIRLEELQRWVREQASVDRGQVPQ